MSPTSLVGCEVEGASFDEPVLFSGLLDLAQFQVEHVTVHNQIVLRRLPNGTFQSRVLHTFLKSLFDFRHPFRRGFTERKTLGRGLRKGVSSSQFVETHAQVFSHISHDRLEKSVNQIGSQSGAFRRALTEQLLSDEEILHAFLFRVAFFRRRRVLTLSRQSADQFLRLANFVFRKKVL